MIETTLKDGIVIRKNTFSLNVNRDRKYSIFYNNHRLISNLNYKGTVYMINVIRDMIEKGKFN